VEGDVTDRPDAELLELDVGRLNRLREYVAAEVRRVVPPPCRRVDHVVVELDVRRVRAPEHQLLPQGRR